MGQPKAAFVFSRRQREQLEGMANSGSLSAGMAIRVPIFLLNAPGKYIQQIARQMGLFHIDCALPLSISAPEMPGFTSIAN
jgi:hypothetical protein